MNKKHHMNKILILSFMIFQLQAIGQESIDYVIGTKQNIKSEISYNNLPK